MSKPSYTPVLLLAMIVGFVGPRLSSPQDRSANAPFAYSPPDGFLPARDGELKLEGLQHAWVYRDPGARTTPNGTSGRAGPMTRSGTSAG